MEISEAEKVAYKVSALVKKIKKADNDKSSLGTLTDDLLGLCAEIPPLNREKNKQAIIEIESAAVTLWNSAVMENTKNGDQNFSALNAKMRHIAFKLAYVCNHEANEEESMQKLTMMALKTSKAWLDSGKASMAESILDIAIGFISKLEQMIEKRKLYQDGCGDAEKEALRKSEESLKKDTGTLLGYQAEAAFELGHHSKTSEAISSLRKIMPYLPDQKTEAVYLTKLTFNFGVDSHKKGSYEQSVFWLRQSFDIGKTVGATYGINQVFQARTLRLLANVYLDWDIKVYAEDAINAVGLANIEYPHPAGLYLKLRILLETGIADDRIKAGMDELLRHPELSEELGLAAIKISARHNRHEVAMDGVARLCTRFDASLKLGSIWTEHLRLLLTADREQEAAQAAEEYVCCYKTGRPLDGPTVAQFHQLFWEQAAKEYKSKSFQSALKWYNYSLSLLPAADEVDLNRAKLQMNRAICYIDLHQLDLAYTAALSAEKCGPTAATYYLLYKITIMQGKVDKAVEALRRMCKCGDSAPVSARSEETSVDERGPDLYGLISLAAHLAMENSNRRVALTALEGLVHMTRNSQQSLIALRCLTRLRLNLNEQLNLAKNELEPLVTYMTLAYERLVEMSERQGDTELLLKECTWFMKMAWNLAVRGGDEIEMTSKLFILCSKMSSMCPGAAGLTELNQKKTCLLIATAAMLHLAKTKTSDDDKRKSLQQALDNVTECKDVLKMIDKAQGTETGTPVDVTTPTLLLLYEFEAQARLGDPVLEDIFEQAISLPNAEAKLFEAMAALSVEPPTVNYRLSNRALKIAIKKHLLVPTVDYQTCSLSYRALVEQTSGASSSFDTASLQEVWNIYTDVTQVIQNSNGAYPEMEIVWLMTKAWNCGIHFYSGKRYTEALQWCELAMKFLPRMTTRQSDYSKKMSSVYAKILDKKSPQKRPASAMFF